LEYVAEVTNTEICIQPAALRFTVGEKLNDAESSVKENRVWLDMGEKDLDALILLLP
jgi:hypothetical protein